jgi:tetratricopeptide (TPR) repeat protein
MMTADERARTRLRALAEVEKRTLDDNARARIQKKITSEGPRVVKRARMMRVVVRASVGVAAIALVASSTTLLFRKSPVTQPPVLARACESFPAALGDRASITPIGEADFTATELQPCRAVFSLAKGTVYVHAKDLGGGELSVQTPLGEAHVRGTKFTVSYSDVLEVVVSEGVVEVRGENGRAHRVPAGQKIRWAKGAAPVLAELVEETEEAPKEELALEEEPSRPSRRARRAKHRSRAVDERRTEAAPRIEPEVSEPPQEEAPSRKESAEPLWPKPERKPDPPADAEELVSLGDTMKRAKEYDRARDAYRRAGVLSGPTAEAAWMALARMELDLGRACQAKAALEERQAHFGSGKMQVEVSWINVRALAGCGDLENAKDEAERLIRDYPRSPQAERARQWLDEVSKR